MSGRMVVLGTDHGLQGSLDKNTINDPSYTVLIEKLIECFSLDYIFEEASGRGPTTASKLQRAGLGYLDVDPPGPERHKYGIPRGLPCECFIFYEIRDPKRPNPEPTATIKSLNEVLAREKYWVTQISATKFASGLIICGCAHTFSVAAGLKTAGLTIEDVLIYMPPEILAKAWLSPKK
jgi:hypothetical protein